MSNDGQDRNDPVNDDVMTGGLQQHGGPDTGRAGSDEAANNPGSADKQTQGSAEKDPEDWTTGDEPATPAQLSYISTMAVEAKEAVPTELTKAEASKKIEELQKRTGRDSSTERP